MEQEPMETRAPMPEGEQITMDQLIALVDERIARQMQDENEKLARKEADLAANEQALAMRQMRARLEDALASRGLPKCLAEGLDIRREEDIENIASALEDAFRRAVQQGVEERLRGTAPENTSLPDVHEMSDQEYYAYTLNH